MAPGNSVKRLLQIFFSLTCDKDEQKKVDVGGIINKQPIGCKAQLAWKCLITPTFGCFKDFSNKAGHTIF